MKKLYFYTFLIFGFYTSSSIAANFIIPQSPHKSFLVQIPTNKCAFVYIQTIPEADLTNTYLCALDIKGKKSQLKGIVRLDTISHITVKCDSGSYRLAAYRQRPDEQKIEVIPIDTVIQQPEIYIVECSSEEFTNSPYEYAPLFMTSTANSSWLRNALIMGGLATLALALGVGGYHYFKKSPRSYPIDPYISGNYKAIHTAIQQELIKTHNLTPNEADQMLHEYKQDFNRVVDARFNTLALQGISANTYDKDGRLCPNAIKDIAHIAVVNVAAEKKVDQLFPNLNLNPGSTTEENIMDTGQWEPGNNPKKNTPKTAPEILTPYDGYTLFQDENED